MHDGHFFPDLDLAEALPDIDKSDFLLRLNDLPLACLRYKTSEATRLNNSLTPVPSLALVSKKQSALFS